MSRRQPRTDDFLWKTGEPDMHAPRRAKFMKHWSLSDLAGSDPMTAVVAGSVLLLHLAVGIYAAHHLTGFWWLATAYLVGGTLAHNLFLGIHEITHDLALPGGSAPNNCLAILINSGIVIPMAMSFRKYHHLHHKHMTMDVVDIDLPTPLEARLLSSTPGKLFFVCFQGFFYTLRPLVVMPLPMNRWELGNLLFAIASNAFLWWLAGPGLIGYLLASVAFGTGLHPMSAHFISEHYMLGETAQEDVETFSEYPEDRDHPTLVEKIWGVLTYNVGYHVEHHDFAKVPWTRLPEVERRFRAMEADSLASSSSSAPVASSKEANSRSSSPASVSSENSTENNEAAERTLAPRLQTVGTFTRFVFGGDVTLHDRIKRTVSASLANTMAALKKQTLFS